MKVGLDQYYVSTFPAQNMVELHSRALNMREGPRLKTWHAKDRCYEVVRGYGQEIRDIMNDLHLSEMEKNKQVQTLEEYMEKYLVIRSG